MNQIIINIIYSAFVYLLISMSVTIEYYTTKFFNLFHAVIITLSAYLVYFFTIQNGVPIYLGISFSILLTGIIGIGSEHFVFRILRKKEIHPFQIMIASLGMYIVFQNLISIIWGDTSLSIRQRQIQVGSEVFGGFITNNQIWTIIISILLILLVQFTLKFTNAGKSIRAVSANDLLSQIFGIRVNSIYRYSFLIGSAFAAVAGILVAFETGLTPNMGFNLFLYGAIVMIIGGTGNVWGLILGAFLIATVQNLSAYYIDSKWMDAIAYIILILFLIWKPLGFSGKQLKKTEI